MMLYCLYCCGVFAYKLVANTMLKIMIQTVAKTNFTVKVANTATELQAENSFNTGILVEGSRQIWQQATRSNALFFSTAIQLNLIKPVFDWFQEKLEVEKSVNFNLRNTISQCEEKSSKQKILEFMKAADLSIEDFQLKTRQVDEKPPITKINGH